MRLALKDGSAVTLRPATNADGPALTEHIYQVLKEHGLTGEPAGADRCLQDLEAFYQRSGGLFEVVEDEAGQLVGCYGLAPEAAGVCELRKMYLSGSVRGKGLGALLLRRALDQAKAKGFRRVELTTAAPLKAAVALYEGFGFRTAERAEIPERCDRAMALDLTASARQ